MAGLSFTTSYSGEGNIDASRCRELWCEVLLIAYRDSVRSGWEKKDRGYFYSKDFRDVCDLAGVCSMTLLMRVRANWKEIDHKRAKCVPDSAGDAGICLRSLFDMAAA